MEKNSQHTRGKKPQNFANCIKFIQRKWGKNWKKILEVSTSKSRLYKQGFGLLHYHIHKNNVKPFNTNHHIFSFEPFGLFTISAKFPSFVFPTHNLR
jgi:hypothetical protein